MGIKLFPIGNIASKVSTGSLNAINYSMFEPNAGAKSIEVHTNLLTTFQDQIKLSRKKAEAYLTITYTYDNILSREYNQLEHFVNSVDDAVTSFFTVNWDKGQIPSNVASSTRWTITLDNTRVYSATSNMKANKVFVYNGSSWKMGDVYSITRNTSVVITVNKGSLRFSNIKLDSVSIYPVYEVNLSSNALSNFEKGEFWEENGPDRGYLHSGVVSFISRYKV